MQVWDPTRQPLENSVLNLVPGLNLTTTLRTFPPLGDSVTLLSCHPSAFLLHRRKRDQGSRAFKSCVEEGISERVGCLVALGRCAAGNRTEKATDQHWEWVTSRPWAVARDLGRKASNRGIGARSRHFQMLQ